MQIVLESPSTLEREFTITIPHNDVETEFEAKIRETSKRIRIDGFRPGKVPSKVVRQRYGQALRQEIMSDLMEKAIGQALNEHNIKPIGQPKIDEITFEEGIDFSFKATFEVFPELDPKLLSGDDVDQVKCKIVGSDVKAMIATLREQRKSWKESVRAMTKDGDRVTINFEGTIKGKPFDGGQGSDHLLIIGSKTMIPGFEDGIIGMKKGDRREIEVTFPDDYNAEELRGKVANFRIDLIKLERGDLPAVDKVFIQSFGVESGDEKDFKAELRQQMERELALALKTINKTKVFDKLLEKNTDAEVPKIAIDTEIETLKQQAIERFGAGKQFDKDKLPNELFLEQAERRVRLGILLGATVKKLDISADNELVKSLIDEMAVAYDDPEQVRNYYLSNDDNLKQIEALAIEEQVASKLLETASEKTIDMSYEQVMKSRQG